MKSSSTSTIGRHLSKCVKYVEFINKKHQTLSLDPSDTDGLGTLSNFSFDEKKVRELLPTWFSSMSIHLISWSMNFLTSS
jgi:hypothetical protein